MTACDVADCPREGTNEIPIEVFDPDTRSVVAASALICDQDFHAVHDAAIAFTLGLEQEG